MEEILASIRRIISEDGDQPQADDEPGAEPESEPVEEAVEEAADAAEGEAEAEVLDLTEVVEEVDQLDEGEDEPLDLNDVVEDGFDADEAEGEPAVADEIELMDEVADEAAVEEPVFDEPAVDEIDDFAEAPAPAAGFDSDLVSQPTAATATASLAGLASVVAQEHAGMPVGQGDRTLEDLVKEVMRPMIREWLDENLPGLVDRLVRREIERMARRAEEDI